MSIYTCYTFSHSTDAIRKRQERVQVLEECRCHFNRVCTWWSRNLKNNQDNAQCLADMLEWNRQCINNINIDKRKNHTENNHPYRMHDLRPRKQRIPQTHNKALNDTDHDIQQPSAHIHLWCRIVFHRFVSVYFHLNDRDQNNTAHPNCQVGIEWNHGRTVILHCKISLCIQFNRWCHKLRNLVSINAFQFEQFVICIGTYKRIHITLDVIQLATDTCQCRGRTA